MNKQAQLEILVHLTNALIESLFHHWSWVMVFSATFNNVSVISWRSVLLVEETGVTEETTHVPQGIDKLCFIMLYRVHLVMNGKLFTQWYILLLAHLAFDNNYLLTQSQIHVRSSQYINSYMQIRKCVISGIFLEGNNPIYGNANYETSSVTKKKEYIYIYFFVTDDVL